MDNDSTRDPRPPGVAARLGAVDSFETLHELLGELAQAPRSRWTRTQILHYLPKRFHPQAEAFFDGERLRPAAEQPPKPEPVDAVSLDEVLRRIHERDPGTDGGAGIADAASTPDGRLPTPRELAASPGYTGPGAGHEGVAGMIQALRDEIQEVDLRARKRFRVRDGRCVDGSGGRFTYVFAWSSEPEPHLPGTLAINGTSHRATVGRQVADGADERFEVVTDAYLGPTIASAQFYVDPTFLLTLTHQLLLRQLEARHQEAVAHVDRLTAGPGPFAAHEVPRAVLAGLNVEQSRAVEAGIGCDRGYVWGPPGTGKTTTLGALVAALTSQGKRVLVVSPYNVAVDAAALSAARRGLHEGAIVRVGRVSDDVRRVGLDLETQLERHAAANGTLTEARQLLAALGARRGNDAPPPATVRACLDELGADVVSSKASARDPEVQRVAGAIALLRQRFRQPEATIFEQARVVACTMALHLVLSTLRTQRFDHVIVDEASVVRPPEAVLLSLHTGAPITFFGDPKQLPPIVVSRTPAVRRWLGRNPFALAGIAKPAHATGACVLLEEQHRMAPPISALVSNLFYDGRLRNGAGAPRAGTVVVVDTSRTPAAARSRMVKLSTSKENPIHRKIVADVVRAALRADPQAGVLVVAPFVAQTRAYRNEATTSRLARGIRFETIHASQGSERDLVVLDLVLAGRPDRRGRSHMFDEERNPHVANLLNVALSRAKRSLVIVGHRDLLGRVYKGGLVDLLLTVASRQGQVVEVPRDLLCRQRLNDVFGTPATERAV